MKLNELRAKRDAVAREMNALNEAHKNSWTNEVGKKWDELDTELSRIDNEIKRELRLVEVNAENALADAITNGAKPQTNAEGDIFRKWANGGMQALTPEEIAVVHKRHNPENAMSTTTGTEGGFTVAPEFSTQVLEVMRAFGGMRSVSTILTTGSGADMTFPASDYTSEEGEIIGQNQPATDLDTAFMTPLSVSTFMYSSKKVAIPFQLIHDSFIDIEAYVAKVIAYRLARIQNKHFTNGTGVGQPRGIVTASAAGKTGANGQTATVTYDDLVDLEHSVDPAYRQNGRWMFHDLTLAKLRKIKDSQNRPIFVPGYEEGNPGGAPDRLLGRAIVINQDVPQMAANAKSILFGDFSRYLIRDVMGVTLFRFADSAFISKGQIGFLAWQRGGGNLIDVGGAVKHYANSAT